MFTTGRPLSTTDDSWPMPAGLLTPIASDEETLTQKTLASCAVHPSGQKTFKSDIMRLSHTQFGKIPSSLLGLGSPETSQVDYAQSRVGFDAALLTPAVTPRASLGDEATVLPLVPRLGLATTSDALDDRLKLISKPHQGRELVNSISKIPVLIASKSSAQGEAKGSVFTGSDLDLQSITASDSVDNRCSWTSSAALQTPPLSPARSLPSSPHSHIRRRCSSIVSPSNTTSCRRLSSSSTGRIPRRRGSTLPGQVIESKEFGVGERWSNGDFRAAAKCPEDLNMPILPQENSEVYSVGLSSWQGFAPSCGSGDERPEVLSMTATASIEGIGKIEEGQINPQKRRSSCILSNRRASEHTFEEEKTIRLIGKERTKRSKLRFISLFFLLNAGLTFLGWNLSWYWLTFAPIILMGNFLDTVMILNLFRCWSFGRLRTFWAQKTQPTTFLSTTIAIVLACYCESHGELLSTLESLADQEEISHHKRMFIIVCDGQAKGKGMDKTTDRVLVEDILKPEREEWFPIGYESWDGSINGVFASTGMWRGNRFMCIVKQRNLGKRDGLILIRTLLYKFQQRFDNPETVIGPELFAWFCTTSEAAGITRYNWIVGVDADTTFNRTCIYELHKTCAEDPRLIGCSGLLKVGFRTGDWNLWNIYQNTEYLRAQCLRRMHQAKGTGKVSCLQGACQIIKICEETCGDETLLGLFGYLPDPRESLTKQIRAAAGEDRNYICLIFSKSPHVRTTMSMKAIAYTDPPNDVLVYLSQRKRWTLSTFCNDIFVVKERQMNLFERICSAADIVLWMCPVLSMQMFPLMSWAWNRTVASSSALSIAAVTLIPAVFSLIITYWACPTSKSRLQYLLGLIMTICIAPFVTPVITLYAIFHMDNFSWGKTCEVEEGGGVEKRVFEED